MLKKRALVVDDEVDIRNLLEAILTKEGFTTLTASTAEEAMRKIASSKPDIIILDLQLPDKDGFEVCKQIRHDPATKHIPIIMLTVQAMDSYKITGLEIGADDYVVKPFNQSELLARIKAVLRRHTERDEKEVRLTDSALVLDLNKHTVTIRGEAVDLSPKEFDMLCLFLKKKGKVLSRQSLSEIVWGQEYFGSTRTVDVHIGRLRKKLAEYGDKIETVERLGYRYKEK